jgi:D-amino peptidase
VLSHTFTGAILDVQVNGRSMGEMGLNAALAGHYGVPVYLVSGDQTVDQEAKELFGDDVITVVVKESRAHMAAESPHPTVARERIRAAAAQALRQPPDVQPLRTAEPVEVELSLARPVYADLAEMIDNVERINGRTVRFRRPDMPSAYRVLRLVATLSSTPV